MTPGSGRCTVEKIGGEGLRTKSRTSALIIRITRYSLFLPLLAVLLPGCKPQEPVYATDKNLGDETQPLMPTGMYFVYGDDLTKGRVGEPDLSHLTLPEENPDDEDSGDSPHPDIQALIERHNEFLSAGEYDKAAELYKEEFRPLAAADFGLITKTMQIVEAMGADSPVAAMLRPMMQAALTANLISTEPEADGMIVGTIQTEVPGAPPKRFAFERVDDEWLFVGEEGTTSDNVDQLLALSDEVGSQLDTILAGMEDGSIDGQSAIVQLQQAGASVQAKADQIRQAAISDSPPDEEPEDKEGEADADEGDEAADDEAEEEPADEEPGDDEPDDDEADDDDP